MKLWYDVCSIMLIVAEGGFAYDEKCAFSTKAHSEKI
jgi:hypothetical protein